MPDPGEIRISLSEARLEAALAAMELRLRVYFDEQLKNKAAATDLLVLKAQVDALDRGDFTEVHRRALTEFINEHRAEREGQVWTRNERWFGAIAVFLSALAVAASIFFGIRSVDIQTSDSSAGVAREVTR